jgi:thioredoxin 1
MSDVLTITDPQHFQSEVLGAELPVLVDFTADRCAPCRAQAPVLERLAANLRGKLRVVEVDADAMPELAQVYRVRGLPTLILLKGGEVLAALVGLTPERRILELVEAAL